MTKKVWKSQDILDLLVKIDRGYEPTETEIKMLGTVESFYSPFASIAELPKTIGLLTALKELTLTSTQIMELPESIGTLSALESLDLFNTRITELSESIGSLTSLKYLNLSYTKIKVLPESIGTLTALKTLFLINTQISELPKSIAILTELEILDLSDTHITQLPDGIGNLPVLKHLDLSNLMLDRIPESLALKGLPFVDRRFFEPNEIGINLHGVTLAEQDISVFLETPSLIPSLYQEEIVTLRECKVIFLGDGEVGKSYTMQRINNKGRKETQNNPYLTKQTHGVEIKDWPVGGKNGFKIQLWDFGGQELLHSMHRCFLTDNTCYLVMVKSRKNEGTDRARFWLENIKEFAPNSPIILMVNIWGNADGERVIDESRLISDYKNIKKVIYCSAKDADDAEFREKVMDSIESTVREAGFDKRTISRDWLNICKKINALSDDKPFLTKEEYHKLCAENGIENENASDLLTFFNNIGVCFSYHRDKEKKELTDYKLLKPIWLTNAIYAIIEEGMVHAQKGVITMESIGQMLCNEAPATVRGKEYRRTAPEIRYKEDQLGCIIDVAEANELCYRIGNGSVFFPALLKDNMPDEAIDHPGDGEKAEYRFVYKYLPDSVVHRLMIRLVKDGVVITEPWFRGMVLGAMGNHRVIICMEGDKTLRVQFVSDEGRPASEFFPLIRNEILNVNRALNLTAREAIAKGGDVFTVRNLLNTYKRGDGKVFADKSDEEYSAYDLLRAFYKPTGIADLNVNESGIVLVSPIGYHPIKTYAYSLRRALYESYGHRCAYCSKEISFQGMDIDYIVSRMTLVGSGIETKNYVAELEMRGFDINEPNYVENYLPCCHNCNKAKAIKNDSKDASTLRHYHDLALKHTPDILERIGRYGEERISQYNAPSYKSLINDFFARKVPEVPSLHDFIQYLNEDSDRIGLRRFVAEDIHCLLSLNNDMIVINREIEDERLQELLYQLYLIDSGNLNYYLPKRKNSESSDQHDSIGNDSGSVDLSSERAGDDSGKKKKSVPSPSKVEKATNLVLESFNKWLKENDSEFHIEKDATRQSAGLQYGYDVGSDYSKNNSIYRLCFECKRLRKLITGENETRKEINVRIYSPNFLQFYMHCDKQVNNRWILVSPYGKLQNDFPEKLFEKWNKDHPFMKVHFITEESSSLKCREFFSVDPDAYKMIYPDDAAPAISDKTAVFMEIMRILGKDDVYDHAIKKLEKYSFWEKFKDSRTLLPIRTVDEENALETVLHSIVLCCKADINQKVLEDDISQKTGVFIVGDSGTGKSWITYQAIEQMILHESNYCLYPVFCELRNLTIGDEMTEAELKETIDNYVDEIRRTIPRQDGSKRLLFVLDGFDELLSGLSKADIKVRALDKIVRSLRAKYSASKYIVTSRESDYNACKNHKDFGKIAKEFVLVQLNRESCTIQDIKKAIEAIKREHKNRTADLDCLLSNSKLLDIMRKPFFFDLIVDDTLQNGYSLYGEANDEYAVLKSIIESTATKLKVQHKERQKWNELAVEMTKSNGRPLEFTPGCFTDEGIKLLVRIESDRIGKRYVSFRHNILREYFVGELMFNQLEGMRHGENDLGTLFLDLIQKTPLTPEIQRAFWSILRKSRDCEEDERSLKVLITQESVKGDSELSTKLMEILLQSGELSGTQEKPLDLSGINTRNLYLSGCILSHLNMRNSNMRNMQLIDVQLNDLDLRGADFSGLQVFSDEQLVCITSWTEMGKSHIAAMNESGQCIIYSSEDPGFMSRYSAQILTVDKDLESEQSTSTCMAHCGGRLLLMRGSTLYDVNNRNNRLYRLSIGDRIAQILPSNSYEAETAFILREPEHNGSLVSIVGGKVVNIGLPDVSNSRLSFADHETIICIKDGNIVCCNKQAELKLSDEGSGIECISAIRTASGIDVIAKKRDSIFKLTWNGEYSISTQTLQEESDGLSEPFCMIRHLTKNTLVAASNSKLYIVLLKEESFSATELRASIKCSNLLLEDEQGNRLNDDAAYAFFSQINISAS